MLYETSPPVAATRWLRRLAGRCWQHRVPLVITFGASLLTAALMAAAPLLVRAVVDNAILATTTPIGPWLLALCALGLVRFGTAVTRRYFAGKLAQGVEYDLRTQIFDTLQRLDGPAQDRLRTGQVISRAVADLELIPRVLTMAPLAVTNLVTFVSALVIMLFLSPLLAFAALSVLPVMAYLGWKSRTLIFPSRLNSQQRTADAAEVVEHAVSGVRVVKGFGQEHREVERYSAAARLMYAAQLRAARMIVRIAPLMTAVPVIGQVGILALGGYLALHGQITLGTFLAFVSYLAALLNPVRMFVSILVEGQRAGAGFVRILEILDHKPTVVERSDPVILRPGPSAVEFDDVSFRYEAGSVLSGFALRLVPGETVALVGSSGSGKTTAAMLLPRFYDPTYGTVRVGGVDVREVALSSLRERVGVVFEEPFLFSDTVRSNIAYGRVGATDEQIFAAARAAEVEDFIRSLPDGYDTVVGERGYTLSGGQRQRLALARALVCDPDLLILDDATSAVDAQVEEGIHATLRRVTRDRTTLLIAHRHSTLQLADRIAVLDDGSVVDTGTHLELLERCEVYRHLVTGDDAGPPGPHPSPTTGPSATADDVDRSYAGVRAPRGTSPYPDADPGIDEAAARAEEPGFTLPGLMRPFARQIVVGLTFIALVSLANLAMPTLIRLGVDDGVRRQDLGALLAVSAVALVVAGTSFAFDILGMTVNARTGERMLYTLRVKMFSHLQRLGLDFYEQEPAGRTITRMTSDVRDLSWFLQFGGPQSALGVLLLLGTGAALFLNDPGLAWAVIAVFPVQMVGVTLYQRASLRTYTRLRHRLGDVNAYLAENIAGLRVIQACGREERNSQTFRSLSRCFRMIQQRAHLQAGLFTSLPDLLVDLTTALVLFVGAGRYVAGTITPGELLAFLLYLQMFFGPVQQLSTAASELQRARVAVRRVKELLATPSSTPYVSTRSPVHRLGGEVVLDDVHFRYPGTTTEALSGLSVTIESGETVAVVGRTGAGKSTLIKLICRFYDPTSGAVRVDRCDLREIDTASYRRRLGIVPQEAYLTVGTVREAIAYGRPDASPQEVRAAAAAVGAHSMITALPGQYDFVIRERGRNLSAGQRQLLALARAQIMDPDILLLDEATSALDLASEAAVHRAVERISRPRTTIILAHRLTTAQRSDRVLVVDAGKIVESGPHDDLVAQGAYYAHLWRAFTRQSVSHRRSGCPMDSTRR